MYDSKKSTISECVKMSEQLANNTQLMTPGYKSGYDLDKIQWALAIDQLETDHNVNFNIESLNNKLSLYRFLLPYRFRKNKTMNTVPLKYRKMLVCANIVIELIPRPR